MPRNLGEARALTAAVLGSEAASKVKTFQVTVASSSTHTDALRPAPAPLPSQRTAGTRSGPGVRAATAAGQTNTASSLQSGYEVNAEGTSWVRAVQGVFTATRPTGPNSWDATQVMLRNDLDFVQLGTAETDTTRPKAYFRFEKSLGTFQWTGGLFWGDSVNPGDVIGAAIIDGPTGLDAEMVDETTGASQFFSEQSVVFQTFTRADWWLQMSSQRVSLRSPWLIVFRGAEWYSNWDSWQPINSPIDASYTQFTYQDTAGGQVATTDLDQNGTRFFMFGQP